MAAADLQVLLRKRECQLHAVDALIAAVSLRFDLTLLTSDGDFSAIAGLHTTDWRR